MSPLEHFATSMGTVLTIAALAACLVYLATYRGPRQ